MVIKVFLGGGGHHLECFGFACWVFFGSIFGRFVVPSDGVTCFSLVLCIVPVPTEVWVEMAEGQVVVKGASTFLAPGVLG